MTKYTQDQLVLTPYIWIKVPRKMAVFASKLDMYIDVHLGGKR